MSKRQSKRNSTIWIMIVTCIFPAVIFLESISPKVAEAEDDELSISAISISESALLINGPPVTYNLTITNNSDETLSNIKILSWIVQGTTLRVGELLHVNCGTELGSVTPGSCSVQGTLAANDQTNGGYGTFSPGEGLLIFRLIEDGETLAEKSISIALTGQLDIDLGPPSFYVSDSRPLILTFHFVQNALQFSNCSPSFNNLINNPVFLYEFEYRVYAEGETYPFFTDRIDLYAKKAPGTLKVSPGIYLPLNSPREIFGNPHPKFKKIKIKAKLAYKSLVFTTPCTISYADHVIERSFEREVKPVQNTSITNFVYNRFRDGYVRRHILDSGRGLSWVWLKEYVPGKDRKELLYHSRTFKAPQAQDSEQTRTRVYVPWIYECDNVGDDWCRNSAERRTLAAYGGHENPLLRGGLAMAVFSLEYLTDPHKNVRSLQRALKLLEYVEASEWIEADGSRTGFFLRSRYPGNIHKETDREYFFASLDEIIGMTLGLLYLDRALTVAGPSYDNIRVNRLEALVHRLGTNMKDNYYFLVPLKKKPIATPFGTLYQWEGIGLPLEKQKGWAGGYLFAWFLDGGFRAIMGGGNYRSEPRDGPSSDSTFWSKVESLEDKSGEEDLFGYMSWVIEAGLKPKDRALTLPIGFGAQMYYGHESVGGFLVISTPWGDIKIPFKEFEEFHLPMLLHAFQLGMAWSDHRTPETIKKLKEDMAVLIRGVLNAYTFQELPMGTVRMKESREIDLCFLLSHLVASVHGFPEIFMDLTFLEWLLKLPDFMCPDFTLNVGTPTADDNLYAAAVARAYHLDWTLSSDEGEKLRWLIGRTFLNAQREFAESLPVGERETAMSYPDELGGGPVEGDYVKKHNPDDRWGQAFVWEHFPRKKVQDGGSDGGDGLEDTTIRSFYSWHGGDVMREGAGLGYLLPQILYNYHASRVGVKPIEVYDNSGVPTLGACFTLPRYLAQIGQKQIPGWKEPGWSPPCTFRFPSIRKDLYDFTDPNDSYLEATLVDWGSHPAGIWSGKVADLEVISRIQSRIDSSEDFLNIDRRTHPRYHKVEYARYTDNTQDYLYVIQNNKLYQVDTINGNRKVLGSPSWSGPASIAPLQENLYLIQNDRLYRVDPNTETWEILGDAIWSTTTSMATLPSGLFIIINNNRLYRVDPNTGSYQVVGGEVWGGPTSIALQYPDWLYIIQNERLHRVSVYTGNYEVLGDAIWSTTTSMTALQDYLYVINNSRLYRVDPDTGSYQVLGGAVWSGSTSMTSSQGNLYVIQNERLHCVDPNTGSYQVLGIPVWDGRTAMTALHRRYDVPIEADYDYYYLINNARADVMVDVAYYSGSPIRVFVDGKEALHRLEKPCVGGETCWGILSITVPGKPRHTIRVTGESGYYAMKINPIYRALIPALYLLLD